MRRLLPTTLPPILRSGEAPSELPAGREWRCRLEVTNLTPIIGGGVEPFEPDSVDFARVPSIRGQLRRWWRALYRRPGESANALFLRESELWGAVDLPERGEKPRALRSLIAVRTEVVEPGKLGPAGWHEYDSRNNRHRALPKWALGSKLGYALFPLQRAQKERDAYPRRQDMPTHSVRTGLRFHLTVTVALPRPCPNLPPELVGQAHFAAVQQVLGALWAWIHFGGLGARTRRGFGALATAGGQQLGPFQGLNEVLWRRLLEGPGAEGIGLWLADFASAAAPEDGTLWPPRLWVGPSRTSAGAAHEELVDLLKTFRQGSGVGRDPGDRSPGQSRWPEPHVLRVLHDPTARYDHPPPRGLRDQVAGGEVGAPRAAFGLPIQFHFKDRGDSQADATLLPPGGAQRLPSPLILRPLRGNGGCFPAVLLLNTSGPDRPEEVHVEFSSGQDAVAKVRAAGGARPPISKLLATTRGDALGAFTRWLEEKGFRQVSASPGRPEVSRG
jgi:CRISPR-associated protein Cmr1